MDEIGIKKTTPPHVQETFTSQEQSGLTIKDYCKKHSCYSQPNTSTIIKNNILYHNGVFSQNDNLMGIKINPEIRFDTEIDYNLYYTEDPDARFFTSYPPLSTYNISIPIRIILLPKSCINYHLLVIST